MNYRKGGRDVSLFSHAIGRVLPIALFTRHSRMQQVSAACLRRPGKEKLGEADQQPREELRVAAQLGFAKSRVHIADDDSGLRRRSTGSELP